MVGPGLIPDQEQTAQPLVLRAVEGNPQAMGRQPVHPFDGQSRRHLPGIDRLDLAAAADGFQHLPQPHQERRVGIRQGDAGNRHHLAFAGSSGPAPQDGLPVAHQGMGFVDDEKAELLHRRGMPDALLKLDQSGDAEKLAVQDFVHRVRSTLVRGHEELA